MKIMDPRDPMDWAALAYIIVYWAAATAVGWWLVSLVRAKCHA